MSRFTEIETLPTVKALLTKKLEAPCFLLNESDEEYILGFGIQDYYTFKPGYSDSFVGEFQSFLDKTAGQYRFGYFSYDLKNEFESFLKSSNEDDQQFLYSFFFVAKYVFIRKKNQSLYFGSGTVKSLDDFALKNWNDEGLDNSVQLKPTVTRESYIATVEKIQKEIQKGNVYELNYCTNFQARSKSLNAQSIYKKLIDRTKAPFSAYLNLKDQHVLCASPERFLTLKSDKLYSQPIKGTAPRGKSEEEDKQNINDLVNSSKEIAENVMIVDLVRNDLSKVARPRSVKVDSLNEVKHFETVHQLVSTVSCQAKDKNKVAEMIQALFPMGSMTGAPKISAMELSEKFEKFQRSLYSGSIGFVAPNGNLDFNVVIRSIIHHKESGKISVPVGGAITIQSDAGKEYEECLTKLEALVGALG